MLQTYVSAQVLPSPPHTANMYSYNKSNKTLSGSQTGRKSWAAACHTILWPATCHILTVISSSVFYTLFSAWRGRDLTGYDNECTCITFSLSWQFPPVCSRMALSCKQPLRHIDTSPRVTDIDDTYHTTTRGRCAPFTKVTCYCRHFQI